MAPYKVYGLYLHPVEDSPGKKPQVTLSADPLDKIAFENKGFIYLGPVVPPGVTANPRDIDRDDSGMPKGPDGSTHDRHPDEVTPDQQPVPWGFPMLGIQSPESTPRTAHAVEAAGLRGGARNPREADVRKRMRDAGVTDEDEIKRALGTLRQGGLLDPQQEVRKLHQQATLPGEVVEKGLTRGMTGVDLTMPPIVSGATSGYDTEEMERRGVIETKEVEVAPGEVVMQQVAVRPNTVVPQAPGDPALGVPLSDEQAEDQKRNQSEGPTTVRGASRPKADTPASKSAK